jgi:hypothetical protein
VKEERKTKESSIRIVRLWGRDLTDYTSRYAELTCLCSYFLGLLVVTLGGNPK